MDDENEQLPMDAVLQDITEEPAVFYDPEHWIW